MTKTDVLILNAESHGFNYRIHLTVDDEKEDIYFEVFDKIIKRNDLVEEIVVSGKIDIYGRCDFTGKCDIFAALSMGEIMKVIYDEVSEIIISKGTNQ